MDLVTRWKTEVLNKSDFLDKKMMVGIDMSEVCPVTGHVYCCEH